MMNGQKEKLGLNTEIVPSPVIEVPNYPYDGFASILFHFDYQSIGISRTAVYAIWGNALRFVLNIIMNIATKTICKDLFVRILWGKNIFKHTSSLLSLYTRHGSACISSIGDTRRKSNLLNDLFLAEEKEVEA